MTDLNLTASVTDGGGHLTWNNPSYVNDGNLSTKATRGVHSGGGPFTLALKSDLGSSQSVASHYFKGAMDLGPLSAHNGVITIEKASSLSGPWTTVTASTYVLTGTPSDDELTITHVATSSRYWRALHTRQAGPGFQALVTMAIWQINDAPPPAPVADFEASTTGPAIGETVTFADLSTNTPTSWAWTFGDGGTSTAQNPTHEYAAAGAYTVTLTATNAAGSDSESKTTYINVTNVVIPEPEEPAGALLEIYASDPGGARWDVAIWDEAVWANAGWQDVTPYGVEVNITWGSNRPELGILSVPVAASWAVDYYDPNRILDPANEEGPYFGDLIPFLPIRVSHRETVIRQGYVTGISHNYRPIVIDGPHGGRLVNGYMRGTDNISRLANAKVPSDTELADTLVSRARDAIAAAGLSVTVVPPLGTDPPVSPWLTGERDWSAWEWITDAAQEVLYIPFIDRLNRLTFRPWASPLTRGRSLTSPELIDLAVVTDYSGLFSVVQAREDTDTLVERALTPPPRYGARTYTRDEITIDPGDWADAVLSERGLNTLLWKPGDLRPLTAVSAEALATIEDIELVGLTLTEQNPVIIASGIVVGGEITIIGKIEDEAVWRFRYELATAPTEPLIETGGGPTDYLLATGGGEYLYPTGGA